ncbi:helix-turn-helix transcriptional regulator [Magnetospirillum sp. SS-4]|uniref:LexA family transcriptional regulator n=1 Tax=Magnetospirillum sp. SS-4 TaxID=2681465 RepID=UPI0013845CC0|nr:helix-turn-helix transcriptional regulator [Magnetospirillum sp. SS-4]CAA7627413.1 Transcriptional regulator [Magnetospirillum sp. SS-4]
MLKHADIWAAIDALARDHGLTASALARKAGLDPTTFNKSKRITREGKARWPSTESVAKVLEATGATMAAFVGYIEGGATARPASTMPLIGFAQAGDRGFFDDAGYPVGGGWDEIPFPEVGDQHAYALEVSGDSMEPLYRDGDVVIVSPAANVRRGDRVVVRTTEGEVMVKQLVRLTARRIDLISVNPAHSGRSLASEEVAWMARILWASQ